MTTQEIRSSKIRYPGIFSDHTLIFQGMWKLYPCSHNRGRRGSTSLSKYQTYIHDFPPQIAGDTNFVWRSPRVNDLESIWHRYEGQGAFSNLKMGMEIYYVICKVFFGQILYFRDMVRSLANSFSKQRLCPLAFFVKGSLLLHFQIEVPPIFDQLYSSFSTLGVYWIDCDMG